MTIGGSILVAVVTAVVGIGLAEVVRTMRERAAARKLAAEWDVFFDSPHVYLGARLVIVENVGHTEAFNVRISITGDSEFELHADAPLDKCRPRDAILVMMTKPGTGVFRIDWADRNGVECGPVFRFPPIK